MNLQWNRTHTVDGRNTAPVDRWFLVCTVIFPLYRVSTIQGDHPQHFSTQQRLNIQQQWTLTSSVYPDSCWSYDGCFLCCHGTWLSVSSICVSINTFATPTKVRNETQYLSVPKCTQLILSDMARLYPKIEYNYRLWYQLFSIIHCFVTSASVLEAGPKKTSGLAVAKARLLRRVRSRSGRKPCKIPWKSQTLEHFWENESSAAAFVGVILSYDTSVYQDIPSMYACFRIPGKWRFLVNSQLLGLSAYLDDSINQKCSRKWNFKP